ncbi:MAG TPA: hypothetical protein VLD38_06885 [Nitrosopumilaceae archaeon]|nr:hypothetical protein [Nitrosopumilaceae archaeon]
MSKKEGSKIEVFRRIDLLEGDKRDEMLCGVIMVLVMVGYLRFVVMQEVDLYFKRK